MVTIDQKLVEFLTEKLTVNGWPWGNLLLSVIALLLTVLMVGAVGIEREKRGRSAGLRTHLLVGVGSCIVMIVSIYGFPAGTTRDVARLAAQVVTGVGFLGAGAIIHRNSGIKGLTTAGTIWAAMAIGLACGSFNFIIALIGTSLIVLVLTIFKKVEVKISKGNPTIMLCAPAGKAVLGIILDVSKKYDCSVHSISIDQVEGSTEKSVEITFQAIFDSGEERVMEYVSELEKATGATNLHLLNHH